MLSKFKCTIAECEKVEEHDDLGIGNVGGVFIMLAGGCLIAFIIALVEFLWNVEKIAIEEKVRLPSILTSLIKFIAFS